MSLSENLSSAAEYVRRFFDRAGDVIILFLITIIPIVDIMTLGYLGRVVSDSPSSRQPPKLGSYGDMFAGGLKFLAAAIIWAIPSIIISAILAVVAFAPLAVAISPLIAAQNLQNFNSTNWSELWRSAFIAHPVAFALIVPGILAIIVVTVIFGIFATTGIVHMFKKGSFGKAFALGEIIKVISRIGWLRYLGLIVVTLVLGFIIAIFAAIPIVGWLISAFLGLLLSIAILRTMGLMYDAAMGTGVATAPLPSAAVPPPLQESQLPATASPVAAQPQAPASGTAIRYCSSCGAANPTDAVYCNKCGKML